MLNSKSSLLLVLTVLSSFVLSACNESASESKDKFTKAINLYLDKKNPACYIAAAEPLPISLRDDGQSFNGSKPQLDALTVAGLLTTEKTLIEPAYVGIISNETPEQTAARTKPLPGLTYSLSALGKKSYQENLPSDNKDWKTGGVGFCFSGVEVANIDDFTQPMTGEGGVTSTVSFTYKVKDPASWSSLPAILKAFPAYSAIQQGKATMQLQLKRSVDTWEVAS